ncbi:MAG: cadmium-translocating P-type ATPase [Planctomycetes bacterium]|nr:cadmium-translocating P-type ATPase [Planctomycetota bacterium]
MTGHAGEADSGESGRIGCGEILRIVFVALAAGATWLRLWRPFAGFDVVAVVATAVGAWPIVKEAAGAVREFRMTMELSMLIAFGAALAIGESVTALLIVLFVLVAEVLEHLTVGRGRVAIRELLEMLPPRALVRRAGGPEEVSTAELRAGDLVVIRPGARIPVDGTVERGGSFVDQAMITGESLPAEKLPGATVFAGSLNGTGALDVRAARIGRDTAFGRIVEAVESAERSRAPIQRVADRFAGWLVVVALATAGATYAASRDARAAISVILVAGACGIAAGTPLAILGAIGRAARRGLIVKGGRHLEALWAVDTVVLDKTGTLTFGDPEVVELRPAPGVSPDFLLATAAAAERPSEHPLARAVLRRAAASTAREPDPERFHYVPGKGIDCLVGGEEVLVGTAAFLAEHGVASPPAESGDVSEIAVARVRRPLGSIRIADVLRPEAAGAVARLRAMGLRTVLLTGDRSVAATPVGRALGVDETGAGLLPDEKLQRIRAMQLEGRVVAMIGDGINDVPALLEAAVGVAMGSGTDVAREAAPVTLIGNDLSAFADIVAVARRCRRIVLFNFAGTLAVDAAGMALGAFGLLNPLAAAAIHVSSELLFILNSARLLPRLISSKR